MVTERLDSVKHSISKRSLDFTNEMTNKFDDGEFITFSY